nr:DUF2169 domain-containing protein [Deltaproteobacteria bacterium]
MGSGSCPRGCATCARCVGSRCPTYDDAWDRSRAPFLPTDFDPRFQQAASEPMWLPRASWGRAHRAAPPRRGAQVESRVPSLGLRVRARFAARSWRCPR